MKANNDFHEFLGDNAVERFLIRLVANGMIPAAAGAAPDHIYGLFLMDRRPDGLLAIAVYGLILLAALAYYLAEWKRAGRRSVYLRYLLRGAVFIGTLGVIFFVIPSGPAIGLSRTASDGNVTVFLHGFHQSPGHKVAGRLQIKLPYPMICDVENIQLLPNGIEPGITIFSQKTFDVDSEGNFFASPLTGGCSCRFSFSVPKDFNSNTAQLRFVYREATRRTIPLLITVRKGSVSQTVPLYDGSFRNE